ncbi:hypothetical protein BDA96_04G378200 [Sorghum bicolor]|uniref:Uncharacterized protein n=1 Tax=Sorghum bicolor TaxID=4558 RepID=A0A921RA93_SORBI|nr:hypothetical protein BDA96_04G378200 [Sorghum bicolor]
MTCRLHHWTTLPGFFFEVRWGVFCSHSAGNWNLQCLELDLVHHIELPHPGSRFCQDNGPAFLTP